jgi:hypothetical protein
MPKTTFRYAVTLEFIEAGPETVRGKLEAANARLGARRAVEAALRAHPGRRWATLVVLLERLDTVVERNAFLDAHIARLAAGVER